MDDKDRVATLLGEPLWFQVDVYSGAGGARLGYITADRIVSVGVHRGRDSASEDVGPVAATVVIKGGYWFTSDADDVSPIPLSVGHAIEAYITGDGLAHWHVATYPAAATAGERFVGTITDLGEVEVDPGDPDTQLCPLIATSARARFGNRAYPADTGTGQVPIFFSYTNDELTLDDAFAALDDIDPVTFALAPVGIDEPIEHLPNSVLGLASDEWAGKTINDVLAVYFNAAGGVLYELRNGHFRWVIPAERRHAAPPVVLDPDSVLAPLSVRQAIGEIINYQEVTASGAGTTGDPLVVARDDVSIGKYGYLPGPPIDTALKITPDASDPGRRAAVELAGGIVGRFSEPGWSTPSVVVDVTQLLLDGNDALAIAVLNLNPADLVRFDSLPRRFPSNPGLYWVELIEDDFTAARLRITLGLVPYSVLTPGTRWTDVPAGVRWVDLPTDLTWVRSYVYDPDPYPAGSFRATPSDLRYRNAGALTWATI